MANRLDNLVARKGFFRDTSRGIIAGVCAGLAGRFGVNRWLVRGGFIAFAVVEHAIPAVVLYAALALVMRARPASAAPFDGGYGAPPRDPFDRFTAAPYQASVQPSAPQPAPYQPGPPAGGRLNDLKTRFTALDARLNRIEATVTSDELALRRKFRDLGG